MTKLFVSKGQVRLLNSEHTDFDLGWYYFRHHQKLKYLICHLVYPPLCERLPSDLVAVNNNGGLLPGGVPARGVYLPGGGCTCPGGVPAQEGGYTCPGGVLAQGGVPTRGVCSGGCTEAHPL